MTLRDNSMNDDSVSISRPVRNRIYDYRGKICRIGKIYRPRPLPYAVKADSLSAIPEAENMYDLILGNLGRSSSNYDSYQKINQEYYFKSFDLQYITDFSITHDRESPATLRIVFQNPVVGKAEVCVFNEEIKRHFQKTESVTIADKPVIASAGRNIRDVRIFSETVRKYDIFNFDCGKFETGIDREDYIEIYEAQKELQPGASPQNITFSDDDYTVCFRGFISEAKDIFGANAWSISISARSVLSLLERSAVVTNQAVYILDSEIKGKEDKSFVLGDTDVFAIRMTKMNYFKNAMSQYGAVDGIRVILQAILHLETGEAIAAGAPPAKDKKPVLPINERWELAVTEWEKLPKIQQILNADWHNLTTVQMITGDKSDSRYFPRRYYDLTMDVDEISNMIGQLEDKMSLNSECFIAITGKDVLKEGATCEIDRKKYQCLLFPVYCFYRALLAYMIKYNLKTYTIARVRDSQMKGFQQAMMDGGWATWLNETSSALEICKAYADATHYVFYEDEQGVIIYDIPNINGNPFSDHPKNIEDYTIHSSEVISDDLTKTDSSYITDVFATLSFLKENLNDAQLLDAVSFTSKTASGTCLDDWRRYGFKLKTTTNFNITNKNYLSLYAGAMKALNNEETETLNIVIPYNKNIKIMDCLYYEPRQVIGFITGTNRSVRYGEFGNTTINMTYLRNTYAAGDLNVPENADEGYHMKDILLQPEYIHNFAFMDNIEPEKVVGGKELGKITQKTEQGETKQKTGVRMNPVFKITPAMVAEFEGSGAINYTGAN